MIESQMDRKIFEDLSGAEGTTLRALIIKYRDEVVPEYKSARTLTYKLNYMLKFKICYYNLLQLNSAHIHKFKKEISDGRAAKTVNMYIQTLQTIWNIARSQWGITMPSQNPFALVTYNKVRNERDVTLTDEEFKRLLAQAALGLTDTEVWARVDAGESYDNIPFGELINFSDADGTIGPVASAKLYNDFVQYEEDVMNRLDRFYLKFEDYEIDGDTYHWFKHKYKDWKETFRVASNNGAVIFH